jgi:predicted permease
MDWLRRDFAFAVRLLRARWGVSSVAILVLALGISLTATMYAIIDGVVFTGPDYQNLERVLSLRTTIPQSQFDQPVRLHDYLDWREQQTVFDEMAAYYTSSANLSLPGEPAQSFSGVHVSASTFALLGKQAMMGRTFVPEDDFVTGEPIILLGHHVWENRYDRDPQIVGKTIRVNARPTTVVGVMPPDFRFPELHDVWMPLELDPGTLERRQGPGLVVLALLNEGTSQTAAQAQLMAIAQRLEEQYPVANREVHPITELWMDEIFVDDETKGLLYTMFTAVFGVLLIACANVANLQFALTIVRGKELAVRTALGASRNRVLRQLLSETVVLAFGGAVVGVVLAKFSLDLFTRVVTPLGIPPWLNFDLSPAVFVFVLGITFFAALASGMLPALHATRVDINSILKDQVRGSSGGVNRWSTSLVVLEVAVSCALLVGAGLTIRSTLELGSADYGLDQENIMTARFGLPGETYPDSTSRQVVTDRFHRELEAIPAVREVAITSNLPILGTGLYFYGVGDGEYVDDAEYPFGGYTRVSSSFFDLIGVPIVAGRGFRDVTESLAHGRRGSSRFPDDAGAGLRRSATGGHVRAHRPATQRRVFHHAPDRRRPARRDGERARTGDTHRSGHSHVPGEHADRSGGGLEPWRTHLDRHVRDLRGRGLDLGVHRPLCRHGLFGQPADRGGRHSYGLGGQWRPDRRPPPAAGRPAVGNWHRHRTRAGVVPGKSPGHGAVPCGGLRSADLHDDPRLATRGQCGRPVGARETGRLGGSRNCSPSGVAYPPSSSLLQAPR